MPYVISDSLFERLEGCVKQQRLLGVMGMLEELRWEARPVRMMETTAESWGKAIRYEIDIKKHIKELEKRERETNSD